MKTDNVEHVDVLIVGAGLSGIGAACHLRRDCPDRSFALLESRESMGGTWDLFRYPGIRSDSDMYTLGYNFRPWTRPVAIADGESIRHYIEETASEYDVTPHIRYRHKVISADWDSAAACWTLQLQRSEAGEAATMTCNFLYICSGYYNYDEGYTPEFAGQANFTGTVVHAQHWPQDLDYRDKRVVVIGSGATAVTLVPELARDTAHTIMLQRSPTYIASVPAQDPWAAWLRDKVPDSWVYHITRWKKVLFQMYIFNMARKRPKRVKRFLLNQVQQELGPDYDVDTHFNPRYNPWDQRLCAVPDADMFKAIRQGRAEVVTDHIECFEGGGIRLQSGKQLEADIIVLATGLNLLFMGGIELRVDGEVVTPAQKCVYRGMMLSDVPNLAQATGYTNSSWTLKADLTSDYVCRLLNHMRKTGSRSVVARLEPGTVTEEPIMDFNSGYVLRSIDEFPKQGAEKPWRVYQNYFLDLFSLRYSSLTGSVLEFR